MADESAGLLSVAAASNSLNLVVCGPVSVIIYLFFINFF